MKCAVTLLLLCATQAFGQVRGELRLEQDRSLQGAPVVVVFDVFNATDRPVASSICDTHVKLAVVGVERRKPPSLSGCYFGMGMTGGAHGCAIDPNPTIAPNQRATYRFVLEDYDLGPGLYSVTAIGTAPGVYVDRTLSLTIVPATADELKRAFAPLVADADGTDPVRQREARAAIIESAPPFLTALIGRFAFEQRLETTAIEALGRIASDESRSLLQQLYARDRDAQRYSIVLTLARFGRAGDDEFLAGVLGNPTADEMTRRIAALGLGRIGGDQAVRYLEGALPQAHGEIRSSIATALGNTRSRLAIPVLVGMIGTVRDLHRNAVCGGLKTLTHRDWCDLPNPVAARQTLLRQWKQDGPSTILYGPDNCPQAP